MNTRGWAYSPTKWEYHFERLDGEILQVQETASALGARGWELVGLHLFPLAGVHMIFKRPLNQTDPTPGEVRKATKEGMEAAERLRKQQEKVIKEL